MQSTTLHCFLINCAHQSAGKPPNRLQQGVIFRQDNAPLRAGLNKPHRKSLRRVGRCSHIRHTVQIWHQVSSTLTPLTLLATLDSSLMNILPSLIKFRPSPKLAITISDSFVVSVLTLILTQLAPLPPPSFTPNSITVILSTTTYLSLRSPASNRSRTLLPVLLLNLLNAVTSLISDTLFIGSK